MLAKVILLKEYERKVYDNIKLSLLNNDLNAKYQIIDSGKMLFIDQLISSNNCHQQLLLRYLIYQLSYLGKLLKVDNGIILIGEKDCFER